MKCSICGAATRLFSSLGNYAVNTTDDRSLIGADIVICTNCSHVSKALSREAYQSVSDLYKSTYPEMKLGTHVNVDAHGVVTSRDLDRAKAILRLFDCSEKQLLHLDVGAGDGSFVNAFLRTSRGSWISHGYEVAPSRRSALLRAGCQKAFAGRLSLIPHKYDLITLFHVLEHVRNPVSIIRSVRQLLAPTGKLVVVVPSYERVNTDFYISEHLQHFTLQTLELVARISGISLSVLPEGLLGAIEIGFVGTPLPSQERAVSDALDYSSSLMRELGYRLNGRHGKVGLFGVGGTGLWLGKLFRSEIDFFVDEDPSKCGREFSGIPTISVDQIDAGTEVYVALNTREQSLNIAERLVRRRLDVRFIVL